MRGVDVAAAAGWQFCDVRREIPPCDTAILVKYDRGAASRIQCRRLIFDPLDCWAGRDEQPLDFFRQLLERLRPDDVIATSPAAEEILRSATMDATVWLLPHHADPAAKPTAPVGVTGEVIYCGRGEFLGECRESIRTAAWRIGMRFYETTRPTGFHNPKLFLAPRLGASATAINRHCKPCVKVENGVAMGVPVLATPDPAIMSLYNVEALPADDWFDEVKLSEAMLRAMNVVTTPRFTLAGHVAALKGIVGS